MTILTEYDPKPVPTRQWDWLAWVDGYEDTYGCGMGSTRDDAITELLDRMENLTPGGMTCFPVRLPL